MKAKSRYANRSKISEKKFRELIRLFSLDVEAAKIAQMIGLNRNTVNRYLNELRVKIARSFAKKNLRLEVKWRWMRVTLDPEGFGGSEDAGRMGRRSCLASLNAMERCTRRLHPIVQRKCFKRLSVDGLTLRPLSIRMVGGAMTDWWIWAIPSTTASTTGRMNLCEGEPISMGLNPSGPLPSYVLQNSKASAKPSFTSTSKSANSVSITAKKISMLKF